MEKTLLEKAQEYEVGNRGASFFSQDEYMLALAWFNNQITTLQASHALYPNKTKKELKNLTSLTVYRLAGILKAAVIQNKLELQVQY